MVANRPMAAEAMAAVDSQPTIFSGVGKVNFPMIAALPVRCIMITMTGTATTPLITALQNKALIGSRAVKFKATPIAVAAAIVP